MNCTQTTFHGVGRSTTTDLDADLFWSELRYADVIEVEFGRDSGIIVAQAMLSQRRIRATWNHEAITAHLSDVISRVLQAGRRPDLYLVVYDGPFVESQSHLSTDPEQRQATVEYCRELEAGVTREEPTQLAHDMADALRRGVEGGLSTR